VYQKCIFVNDVDDIAYGSKVQKAVCSNMLIPAESAEDFWNMVGGKAVEETIRRKRNTITNAMKLRFQKYCKDPSKTSNECYHLRYGEVRLCNIIYEGLVEVYTHNSLYFQALQSHCLPR
jgi:hypothetical protein